MSSAERALDRALEKCVMVDPAATENALKKILDRLEKDRLEKSRFEEEKGDKEEVQKIDKDVEKEGRKQKKKKKKKSKVSSSSSSDSSSDDDDKRRKKKRKTKYEYKRRPVLNWRSNRRTWKRKYQNNEKNETSTSSSKSEYESDENSKNMNRMLGSLKKEIENLKEKIENKESGESYRRENRSESYERGYKVKPSKLMRDHEFRLWLDEFQLFVSQYDFYKAFNLEKPEKIDESDTKKRNYAKSILLSWVDDSYKEVMYGESCPSECLRKIKLLHEPELGISDTTYTDLMSMKYNPVKDTVEGWCTKAEGYHRKLLTTRSSWTKNDLRDCLFEVMKMPFETWELTIKSLPLEKRTYEEYKSIAMQLEKKSKERQELFYEERIVAHFAKEYAKRYGKSNNKYKKNSNKYRKFRSKYNKKEKPRLVKGKYENGKDAATENHKKKTSLKNVLGSSPCHLCGSLEHWMKECPRFDPDHKVKLKRKNLKMDQNKEKKLRKAALKAELEALSSSSRDSTTSSSSSSSENESSTESDASAKIATKSKRKYFSFQATKCLEDVITFIGDSGASDHMINQIRAFFKWREPKKISVIRCANSDESASIPIEGIGKVIVKTNKGKELVLKKVIYSSKLSENLLSIPKLVDNGMDVFLSKKSATLIDQESGEILGTGERNGGYWKFSCKLKDIMEAMFTGTKRLKRGNEKSVQDDEESSDSEREEEPRKSIERWLHKINETGRPKSECEVNKKWLQLDSDDEEEIPILQEKVQRDIDEAHHVNFGENLGEETIKDLKDLKGVDHTSLRKKLGYLWHLRLGHASVGYLKKLGEQVEELKDVSFTDEILDCEVCRRAKMTKQPHKRIRYRFSEPLALIHTDLLYVSPVGAIKKSKYVVTFTDDFSRFTMTYTLVSKVQVGPALKNYLQLMRAKLGDKKKEVHFLRLDGGTEYLTDEVKEIIKKEDMFLDISSPASSEMNGVAERINKTLVIITIALLLDCGLPLELWELALVHATQLHNKLPHSKLGMKTPYELIHKRKPSLNFIKRFGCVAYTLTPYAKKKNFKVEPDGEKGIYVGNRISSSLIMKPESKEIIQSSNVVFTESLTFQDAFDSNVFKKYGYPKFKLPKADNKEEGIDEYLETEGDIQLPNVELNKKENIKKDYKNEYNITLDNTKRETKSNQDSNVLDDDDDIVEVEEEVIEAHIARYKKEKLKAKSKKKSSKLQKKSKRNLAIRREQQNKESYAFMCEMNDNPKSVKDALNRPDRNQWKEAIMAELEALTINNKTWKYVKRPNKDKIKYMDSKWVFTKKMLPDGKVRYKARLVSRGFKDKNVYDYSETYAPVAGLNEVRALFALANKYDWDIEQMDVDTAFLNSDLEKPVLMEIPEGVDCTKEFKQKNVCLLQRGLYGLKTAAKLWYKKFSQVAKKLNFEVYENQVCLYYWKKRTENEKKVVIILLYVDDILITGNCPDKIRETKRQLCNEFKMKILGEPKSFLGIDIIRDRKNGVIELSQKKFVVALLKRFELEDAKPCKTPMRTNANKKLCKKTKIKPETRLSLKKGMPYRQLIGGLLYLQGGTRPDISYAVNVRARSQSNPTIKDWLEAERILKYLKGTQDLCLRYTGQGNQLSAYSDASLGRHDIEGKSTTGCLIKVFGDTIAWKVEKQRVTATSSMESEYIAMSKAAKILAALKALARRLVRYNSRPTLNVDNKAAISAAKADMSKSLAHLTKLEFHYVRNSYRDKELRLRWVSTKLQLADMMTKALGRETFEKFRKLVMFNYEEV